MSIAMLSDDVRGHVSDVLARDGIGVSRTLELIQGRTNGATTEQLLKAAIALLREQAEQIAELEAEVDELTDEANRLQDEIDDLEVVKGQNVERVPT